MKNLSVKYKLIFAFMLSNAMLILTCFLAFSIQRQAKDNMAFTYEKSIPKINFIQEVLNSIYQYSLQVEQILRIENKEEFISQRKKLEDYYISFKTNFEKFIRDNPEDNYDDFNNRFTQVTNNTQTKLDLHLSKIELKSVIDVKWGNAKSIVEELIAYVKELEVNLAKNINRSILPIQKLEKKLSHNNTFESLMMKSMTLNDVLHEIQGVSNTTNIFSYRNKFSLNYQNIILELSKLQKQKYFFDFEKSRELLELYNKNDNLFKLTARYIELEKTLDKLNETNEVYNSELYAIVERYVQTFKEEINQRREVMYSRSNYQFIFLIISSLFFLVISAVIFHIIIQRDILKRLKKLSEVTIELAKGNREVQIQVEGKDEITEMADAAFIFKENLIELATSKAKLEDAYEELQQFAYRTSHDLKAPLVTIQGLSKIIQSETHDLNNDTVQECLKRIDNLSVQLSTLIEDILNLAKSDLDHQNEMVIDIESYLQNSLQKFSGLCEREIEIKRHWKHSILICEPTRFLQVFENLISNAYKYADYSKEKSFIELRTYEEGKYFVLEVEDNGLGIPQDNQKRLFKMFNRFHETSFGSGLGLYLTKKHIDRMMGNINYENRGGNTVFIVKLPLKKVELPQSQRSE